MLHRNQSIVQLYDTMFIGIKSCSLKRLSKPTQEHMKSKATISESTIKSIDVVCVRGRSYWGHEGNQMYRKLIDFTKSRYSKAPTRFTKSIIVSEIIDAIHRYKGRFIKKVGKGKNSHWVECDELFIREKITQSLRDGLSFKYSSSTKRKRERKAQVQEIFDGDIDKIVHSNSNVSMKINTMKRQVENANRIYGNDVLDETILRLFDQANLDMLETIKKDRSMLNQLHCVVTNQNNSSSSTSAAISSSDHYRGYSETPSFSSSAISTLPPQFAFNSSTASSTTSPISSSYTTASSCLSTTMPTAASTSSFLQCGHDDCFATNINNSYDDDDDTDEVILDLDASFMFLDEMRTY
ncbi:MAG: hypothetical protein ACI8RD_009506 [Bacillariaceae sp.]|jgi:hypothetical protein